MTKEKEKRMTMKLTPEERAAIRDKRVADGKCRRCGIRKPPEPGQPCAVCRERSAEAKANYARKIRAAGENCVGCGSPPHSGDGFGGTFDGRKYRFCAACRKARIRVPMAEDPNNSRAPEPARPYCGVCGYDRHPDGACPRPRITRATARPVRAPLSAGYIPVPVEVVL